jgi:hypothetical protein
VSTVEACSAGFFMLYTVYATPTARGHLRKQRPAKGSARDIPASPRLVAGIFLPRFARRSGVEVVLSRAGAAISGHVSGRAEGAGAVVLVLPTEGLPAGCRRADLCSAGAPALPNLRFPGRDL